VGLGFIFDFHCGKYLGFLSSETNGSETVGLLMPIGEFGTFSAKSSAAIDR
jgi:hypothetical protein